MLINSHRLQSACRFTFLGQLWNAEPRLRGQKSKVNQNLQHIPRRLITSCARGDTICPRPSPPPVGAQAPCAPPSRCNVAVLSPRRISSHADRCSCLTCYGCAE